MPRKKLIRHFEPRYGVSREMVDVEAQYVGREHADWMLLSTADLRRKLQEVGAQWAVANDNVEALVRSLPDRDALAMRCLLVRDLFLLMELYGSCLKAITHDQDPQPVVPAPPPPTAPAGRSLPFSEWLFEPQK